MSARTLGRFTVDGSPELEARAGDLARRAGAAATRLAGRDALVALVLLGGYGRGEGGVESGANGERLHNNLDLLLVTARPDQVAPSRLALEPELDRLAREHRVGIDLGVMPARSLRRAPPLVMWCDMRAAHKTLAGDQAFVPSLAHLSLDRMLAWDVEALLVNRATLLALNEALRAAGRFDPAATRAIVKHLAKAVIGYGDAALFFVGRYHPSYLEKARRVQERRELPSRFRELHAWASAFRLRPDYAAPSIDPWAATQELLELCPGLHLRCTSRRLDTHTLSWTDFARRVLAREIADTAGSAGILARRARGLLDARPSPAALPLASRLGARLGGARAVLGATLPAVLYPLGGEADRYRREAASLLGARDGSRAELRRAYLALWTREADPNASRVLEQLALAFNAPGGPL